VEVELLARRQVPSAAAIWLAGMLVHAPACGRAAATQTPAGRSALRSPAAYLHVLVEQDPQYRYEPEEAERSIATLGRDLRRVFYGARCILDDSLQAQFLGLSTDALRREWWRRYCALRDPTPTTPENEWLVEHEARVAYAREHFHTARPPYWDARGDVYIQWGAPLAVSREDSDVRIGVGYVPKREVWQYRDPAQVAVFEQPSPASPWVYGISSAKQSNRPDILRDATEPGFYAHPDLDLPTFGEIAPDARGGGASYAPSHSVIVAPSALESGKEGYATPGAAHRPLRYVFDADVFRGPEPRVRVEVHVQMDLRDLGFAPQDSLEVARYRVEAVMLDDSVRVEARADYDDSVSVQDPVRAERPTLWPGQVDFALAPGLYRLVLRVIDRRTTAEGTYKADVRVPALAAGKLALSDVEMASAIDALPEGAWSRFAKHGRVVVPNPVATYGAARPMLGYFEVYGLRLDAAGHSRYRVTYALVPRTRVRRQGWFPKEGYEDRPYVSASFTGSGRERDAREELHIDVAALEPDDYDLTLTVRDLLAGSEATTRAWFHVAARGDAEDGGGR
jgi:GWxTD domain-containing protein